MFFVHLITIDYDPTIWSELVVIPQKIKCHWYGSHLLMMLHIVWMCRSAFISWNRSGSSSLSSILDTCRQIGRICSNCEAERSGPATFAVGEIVRLKVGQLLGAAKNVLVWLLISLHLLDLI